MAAILWQTSNIFWGSKCPKIPSTHVFWDPNIAKFMTWFNHMLSLFLIITASYYPAISEHDWTCISCHILLFSKIYLCLHDVYQTHLSFTKQWPWLDFHRWTCRQVCLMSGLFDVGMLFGWWFGTFGILFHILGIILPFDELIFFRWVGIPPTSYGMLGCI